jgi:hypothetical protein
LWVCGSPIAEDAKRPHRRISPVVIVMRLNINSPIVGNFRLVRWLGLY